MWNMVDQLAEQKSKQAYYTGREHAQDYFDQQKSAMMAIADTEGFKEIKNYFFRQLEVCIDRLQTAKSEDIREVQGSVKEIKSFLDFLTNLTTVPPKA